MIKKILFILCLSVVILVAGINLAGARFLSGVLQNTVGVPVSVGRIRIDVFSSILGLYKIKVLNPPGYKEKTAAEIGEISVQPDFSAIFGGKIRIKTIRLDFTGVTIERNSRGKINLMELGAMKGPAKPAPEPPPQEAPPASGKPEAPKKVPGKPLPLQIDEVLVNIGKVRYVNSGAVPPSIKELDLGIHNEVFRDVTQPTSLIRDIVFLILRKIGLSSLTGANLDMLAKSVGGELQSTFNEIKRNLFK